MTHADTAKDRLESWKEIAAYLDRDVRTVQRWEKQEGLPVHRHEHRKRGTVYAFRQEIESWRKERSQPPTPSASGYTAHQERAPQAVPTGDPPRLMAPSARLVLAAGMIAAALLPAVTAWWLWPLPSEEPPDRLRIVVLPFQNVGGARDFFSQGLTEELITGLGNLAPSQLGVIASTSAMHYLGTSKTVSEIARELQVDYLVEGAIRRGQPAREDSPDSRRVDIRLIRASDATMMWTRSYDLTLSQGLALQRDLASSIAQALSPSLVPDPTVVPSQGGQEDWRAWEAYLRGRFLWNKATRDGFEQALDSFQQALRIDPSYVRAHLGTADTYFLLAHYGLMVWDDAILKARQSAEKALDLDPQSPQAMAATAYARNLVEPETESNEGLYRRALTLHPRHPGIRRWYGSFLRSHRRQEEALEQFRQARQLDPLSSIILLDLAWCHHDLGQYQQALGFYDRVEALDPQHAKAHYLRGLTLAKMGRFEQAIESLKTAVPLSDDSPHYLYSLADTYLEAGYPGQAAEVFHHLQELSTHRHVSPRLLEKLQSRLQTHPAAARR